MNKLAFLALLLSIVACQTVKIKRETYKTTLSPIELGVIGVATSKLNLEVSFETKTIPVLENKIKLQVNILPFNKKLAKAYLKKTRYQQNLYPLPYNDTIAVKPELVTIKIADKLGYINELNGEHNKSVFTLIENLQNTSVISSIAVYFNNEDLAKLKLADTYYLTNNQEKKYTIALYKQGKKIETLDIDPKTILGYQINTFCWTQTPRGKSYLADMVNPSQKCKGKTQTKINESQKETSLFKM